MFWFNQSAVTYKRRISIF